MQALFLLLSFHMEKQTRAEGSKAKTVLKVGKADINLEITTFQLGSWEPEACLSQPLFGEVNVGPIAITCVGTAHCL